MAKNRRTDKDCHHELLRNVGFKFNSMRNKSAAENNDPECFVAEGHTSVASVMTH